MAEVQVKSFPRWALIRPAEDLKDKWVVHCLDHDVVTVGDSPRHAFQMLVEALVMVLTADLKGGRSTAERRAPAEHWDQLWDVLDKGVPLAEASDGLDPWDPSAVAALAIGFSLSLKRREAGVRAPKARLARKLTPECVMQA